MYHVWIWLVSSALDSVEGRVWTAHAACQVSWNVADSRGCVLTRDWVTEFLAMFSGRSLLSHPAYPEFSLGHMCTHDHNLCTFSSHGPHESAHHTCSFTFMSHRS